MSLIIFGEKPVKMQLKFQVSKVETTREKNLQFEYQKG